MKIQPGKTSPCEVVNHNGITVHQGTHTACLDYLREKLEQKRKFLNMSRQAVEHQKRWIAIYLADIQAIRRELGE